MTNNESWLSETIERKPNADPINEKLLTQPQT